MNYFELYQLPVKLLTDQPLLSKRYFELQKKYHPDFFTNADEAEQADALETSSLINKGLKILQRLDETIAYVLQLKGLLVPEEKYQLSPEFLMEMMELNEQLLEEEPEDFKNNVEQLEKNLYNEVKDVIENYDDNLITDKDLLPVKEYYFKKKYLQRILDRLGD